MHHAVLPFQVQLGTLVEGENQVALEGSGEELDIQPSDIELIGPVTLTGSFYRAEQHVEIQARLGAVLKMECDLCTASTQVQIDAPFRLFCEKRAERDRRTEAESREEDTGLLYHDGRVLDLREEIREVLLLEVPWHPLCRPKCRGLCAQCGRDMNEGDCDCPPRRAPSPWDLLRDRASAEDGPSPQDS